MGQSARGVKSTLVMGNLVENFQHKKHFNRFTFKSLYKAIDAAGMVDMLSGGDYTVFAPSDAAFEELGTEAFDALLADKDKLTSVIKYMMVEGAIDGDTVKAADGKKFKTVQGGELTVDSDGTKPYVDDAMCNVFDIEVDNGRFHVVDWVNYPKA